MDADQFIEELIERTKNRELKWKIKGENEFCFFGSNFSSYCFRTSYECDFTLEGEKCHFVSEKRESKSASDCSFAGWLDLSSEEGMKREYRVWRWNDGAPQGSALELEYPDEDGALFFAIISRVLH